MPKPAVAKLKRLAESNAKGVSSAIDGYVARARGVYEKLAPDALKDDAGSRLAAELHDVLHDARTWGHTNGAGHVLDELKTIAPKASVNLSAGGPPRREDVAAYVQDAVVEALTKAKAAAGGGWEQAFVDAFYRAEVLIEDQTVREYERGRTAAYASLVRLEDNPERGFVVAREADEARADTVPVVALLKRRSEINDARTCEVCKQQDGQLRILAQGFEVPVPAHPRCRGISHLWAVGWPWKKEQKAMGETQQATGEVLRIGPPLGDQWEARVDSVVDGRYHGALDTRQIFTLDIRAIEIDEKARTIRNCVVSDESLDSHESIIRAAGWDLSRYAKNPILLWSHAGGSMWNAAKPADALGNCAARVEGKKLICDVMFAPEGVNEQADQVFALMVAKVLRAFSVGFRATEWHWEKSGGGEILIVDKAILVEVSVVLVGSNENALAREFRAASGGVPLALEGNPVAAVPQERNAMTTEKTQENAAPTVALPAELASKMGVATVEAAVRAWDDQVAKATKAELELDKTSKSLAEAQKRADTAEKALNERVEKDTSAEVEGLIRSGRISEAKRESALKLLRSNAEAFRELYPKEDGAPLERVLNPEPVVKTEPGQEAPAQSPDANPIVARAEELMRGGMAHFAAWQQAGREYFEKCSH